jgi:5'-3' exonuclease
MEGEHKIIRYIDTRMKENKEEVHVIYGLDADLIMLSLSLKSDNIYLIREKSYFGRVDLAKEMDEQEFSYLYLKTMKKM